MPPGLRLAAFAVAGLLASELTVKKPQEGARTPWLRRAKPLQMAAYARVIQGLSQNDSESSKQTIDNSMIP